MPAAERMGTVASSPLRSSGVAAAAAPPPAKPGSHPLGRLGRPTLWHLASEQISSTDGGSLGLWQALKEKAAGRKGLPAALDPEDAIGLLQDLFDTLRELLEDARMPVGGELVECLFKACAVHMLNLDGARELLLPMLRVAAEHANISSEEARRLQLQYAFPSAESKEASAQGRRGSHSGASAPASAAQLPIVSGRSSPDESTPPPKLRADAAA